MSRRSLSHLGTRALLELLKELLARDHSLTAEILHVLMEVDRRRLWVPAGYPSMYAWCMGELGLSEDMAAKRICAARLARKYPVVLDMVSDGRLHLSGLLPLAKRLTPQNAEELLAAAAHRSRRFIEDMLARRFPQPDLATRVSAVMPASTMPSPAPGRVEVPAADGPAPSGPPQPLTAPGRVELPEPDRRTIDAPPQDIPAPERVTSEYPSVTPLAPERYALQLTMSQAMHDKLRHAQELLPGTAIPAVLEQALDALIGRLEKTRFAATDRPRAQRSSAAPQPVPGRHIPAHVKREVSKRDQGRCTFVSEHGRRCEARRYLEYDHIEPVARGGQATVQNIRLRCRAHNQYEAELAFGTGFMHAIRERARRAALQGDAAEGPGPALNRAQRRA